MVARTLNENNEWLVPSHFLWLDAAKIFLHWLLYYGTTLVTVSFMSLRPLPKELFFGQSNLDLISLTNI